MVTASKYQWKGHSVTSARVDLTISNNGTWQDAFQFGDPDDTTWDIQGQRFELDVRLNPYDTTALLTLTNPNGRIITDSTVQRVIHFQVDPADIQASLRPGTYVYDLIMVDVADTSLRVPLMHGTLTVVQGVTDLSV